MAQLSEDQLLAVINAMGNFGAAAEAAARSLSRAANSADSVISSSVRETEAKNELKQQTDKIKNSFGQLGGIITQFSSSIISTTDAVASSNQVFSGISPAITTLTSMISGGLQSVYTIGAAAAGALLGSATGPLAPLSRIAGSKLGAALGEFLGKGLGKFTELAGTIFNQYLNQGEKVIQSFNTLSTVGVTFGGSLDNMRNIIKDTGLSLQDLSKIAQQNGENLALLGGGTETALARIAKVARNDLGPQLVTLYGGFTNLTDELIDIAAMEKRRGVQTDLLSAENIEGTRQYLYHMKELSNLTGKNTKQLRTEMEARNRHAAAQLALSQMTEQQKKNYEKLMAVTPDGLMKDLMQESFIAMSRGMEPISELYLKTQAMTPEITNQIRTAVSASTQGPEAFNKALDQYGKNIAQAGKDYTVANADLLVLHQAGRLSSSVITNMNDILTSINSDQTRLKSVGEAAKSIAESMDALKKNSSTFADTVGNLNAVQSDLKIKTEQLIIGISKESTRFQEFGAAAAAVTETLGDVMVKFDSILAGMLSVGSKQEIATPDEYKLNFYTKQKEAFLDSEMRRRGIEVSPEDLKNLDSSSVQLSSSQQKRLQDLEQKILDLKGKTELEKNENSSNNTSTGSSVSSSTNSNSEAVPVTNAQNTTLNVNPEPITSALHPYMQNQEILISDLTYALKEQGIQFKRIADRMA